MDLTAMPARLYRPVAATMGLSALLGDRPKTVDASVAAEILAECATPGATLVVGVTGSVAAGKTTFCASIAGHLRSTLRVDVISTDGFLLPNNELASRGLIMRKGFPESYDLALLSGVLQRARWGPVRVPGYSHTTYDRAPDLDRTIDRPDILLVEGLGFSLRAHQRNPAALLDLLIYLDASEADLETWFVKRFMALWREASTNPNSFYARFSSLTETEADAFARQVWTGINLPNLREHIAPVKHQADILVSKAADHSMQLSLAALIGEV